MKYKQLLEIEYQLKLSLRKAETEWDEYVKYGKESALYKIAHMQVKTLRQSIKDINQAITIMGENNLYTYGD